MNFGELIFNFHCNIRSKIRYLEKLEKKLVKAKVYISTDIPTRVVGTCF